jgi:hypothetical protein
MNFNFELKRKNYEEWAADFALKTEYDASQPMGNIAFHLLQDVVCATLVGMHDRIKPLCSRVVEWMDDATKNQLSFGESDSFYWERLSSGKALAKWIDDGGEWLEAWDDARRWHDVVVREGIVYTRNQISNESLDDLMSECFQSKNYAKGVEAFENFYGVKKISLKKKLKPREFAYALCLNQIEKQFDSDELLAAGRTMLSGNLQLWLGSGQYSQSATWLKIVHWHSDKSLSPLQTILKAYDDMPSVKRPVFLDQT